MLHCGPTTQSLVVLCHRALDPLYPSFPPAPPLLVITMLSSVSMSFCVLFARLWLQFHVPHVVALSHLAGMPQDSPVLSQMCSIFSYSWHSVVEDTPRLLYPVTRQRPRHENLCSFLYLRSLPVAFTFAHLGWL